MIGALSTVATILAIWAALGAVAGWCFGKIADATLGDGHDA